MIWRFAVRRLVGGLVVVFAVATLVFVISFVLPLNPAAIIAGPDATHMVIEEIRRALGLDLPIYVQYLQYIERLLHGNLGYSYVTNQPVIQAIAERLPYTLAVLGTCLVGQLIIGVPIGVLGAWKRQRRWATWVSNGVATLALTIPSFWLGLILLYVFAYQVQWLPLGGVARPTWIIAPAVALAFTGAGRYIRMANASMSEVLVEDYIRTARAKGVSTTRLLYKHALRNAARPLITMTGMDVATLAGGTLIVEKVFGIPGLGMLAWQAVQNGDLPVISGVLIVVAVMVVLAALLIDVAVSLLDARIRLERL